MKSYIYSPDYYNNSTYHCHAGYQVSADIRAAEAETETNRRYLERCFALPSAER